MLLLFYILFLALTIFNIWSLKMSHAIKHTKHSSQYNHSRRSQSIHNKYTILIVPLMNRDTQLALFESHMCSVWNNRSSHLLILVVNQTGFQSFSRGWLFNIGLDFVLDHNISSTCIALHDVDLLPFSIVSYETCDRPLHLSSEAEHFGWGVPYEPYSGGVFIASLTDWLVINGMSNLFKGWGGEDDEMFHRWKNANLTDGDRPHRPPKGYGKFNKNKKEHHRGEKSESEYSSNLQLLHDLIHGIKDKSEDGLAQVKYNITGLKTRDLEQCNVKTQHMSISF